ncbi:hypothetical protein SAMN02745724_02427 [Pseudoalteromonas denitrificans DSM 6059]|uniref:Uncharacterized protein n=1 Tax=Pseudoalteromonas denitrificans DSM 6059 TaxID=1123010 RepID=A0A1I1LPH6_9GAMM|nr:hypothetical protein SAMN02745724_02427 [Pseudoalteromonas denitrificans DSM 6059]
MNHKISIYKAFTLICLPFAIVYQLIWSQVFTQILSKNWSQDRYSLLTNIKFFCEICIYALMLLMLIKFTHKPNKLMAYIIYGIFALIQLITLKALCINLGLISF